MKRAAYFFVILLMASALWAQNRYALVIGNADYPQANARLPKVVNDTSDIHVALKELGYRVELKQNLKRLDMIREVDAFIARLKADRNSEGFFWYAGHAIEIDGENFLMPLDVFVDEGKEMIKETSYSVTELIRQLDGVRNKVNVVVFDTGRVPPGDRGPNSDYDRVMKILKNLPLDLIVIYSGMEIVDSPGLHNSPFTEAFLKHMKSEEPLIVMIGHVVRETMLLTQQKQRPYFSNNLISDAYYSLNPAKR